MLAKFESKASDESARLRESYLSRLHEISSSIETRGQPPAAPFVVAERGPRPSPSPSFAETAGGRSGPKSAAPGPMLKPVPSNPSPVDNLRQMAEEVAPKFADAIVTLLGVIRREAAGEREALNAGVDRIDNDFREHQRVILSLEEKVRQLEQKLGAQQELLQEQLSRLRAAVVGIEQRMVSVEGRVNTQASAIRSLHGAQDQRREELLSALQRLGDLGGSRMATQLPENL